VPPAQTLPVVEALIGRAMTWADLLAASAKEAVALEGSPATPPRRMHTRV